MKEETKKIAEIKKQLGQGLVEVELGSDCVAVQTEEDEQVQGVNTLENRIWVISHDESKLGEVFWHSDCGFLSFHQDTFDTDFLCADTLRVVANFMDALHEFTIALNKANTTLSRNDEAA
jgi:hypothetical protein